MWTRLHTETHFSYLSCITFSTIVCPTGEKRPHCHRKPALNMTPFTIDIPDEALTDLADRLQRWRKAADFGNTDSRYGLEGGYLGELVDYWINDFDWRAQETKMNRYDHYRVDIDGIPVHFMHVKGKGEKPVPLLMSHGWPWTFWDFQHMIDPLSDPLAHGGSAHDAFDLVIPSLPGFGFSSPLEETGVGYARTAQLWDKLMHQVLGYERYAVHGGDWGSLVSAAVGHLAHERVIAVHESMGGFLGLNPYAIDKEDYAEEEKFFRGQVASQMAHTSSHLAVHSRDPQTLAYALNDSPVGLAAWIVERRQAWSDCGGSVENCFSKDELLANVSIYWHTQTIGTSMRFYWESLHGAPWKPVHEVEPAVPVPSGFAVFPKDNILVPRKAAERFANVQHWTLMPRGGHFAAAEEPELLVEDIRAFFGKLRETNLIR